MIIALSTMECALVKMVWNFVSSRRWKLNKYIYYNLLTKECNFCSVLWRTLYLLLLLMSLCQFRIFVTWLVFMLFPCRIWIFSWWAWGYGEEASSQWYLNLFWFEVNVVLLWLFNILFVHIKLSTKLLYETNSREWFIMPCYVYFYLRAIKCIGRKDDYWSFSY